MSTVGTTYKDVSDQLRFYLGPLKHVIAAYLTISMNPVQVQVWTLLDARDEHTDDELARAEIKLMTSFPVAFDFTTVHLQGRNPVEFIAEGALPVIVRDRSVRNHFVELLSNRHARA